MKVGDTALDPRTCWTIGDAEKQLVREFDVGPAKPSLAMTATPRLVVEQGGRTRCGVRVGRANFEGPVAIRRSRGIGTSSTAAEATVPPGSGEAEASIAVSAQEFATGGSRRLKVVARSGGLEVASPVEVEVREAPRGDPPLRSPETAPATGPGQRAQGHRRARPLRGAGEGALQGGDRGPGLRRRHPQAGPGRGRVPVRRERRRQPRASARSAWIGHRRRMLGRACPWP